MATFDLNMVLPSGGCQEVCLDDDVVSELIPMLVRAVGHENMSVADLSSDQSLVLLSNGKNLEEQCVEDDSNMVLATLEPLGTDDVTAADVENKIRLYWQLPKVEGYLLKKGEKGLTKSWKRRWFSLDGRKLKYFKSPNRSEPLGHINILNVVYACTSRETSGVSKNLHDCVFQVNTSRRIYYLLAKTVEDKEHWVRQLETCRKVLNASASALPQANQLSQRFSITEEEDEQDEDINPEDFVSGSSPTTSPRNAPEGPKKVVASDVELGPELKGWLFKKGDKGPKKTWKKRWFVLRDSSLAYFKHKVDLQYINYIPLLDILSVDLSDEVSDKKLGACGFALVTENRTWYLTAPSPDDRDVWVERLSRFTSSR